MGWLFGGLGGLVGLVGGYTFSWLSLLVWVMFVLGGWVCLVGWVCVWLFSLCDLWIFLVVGLVFDVGDWC